MKKLTLILILLIAFTAFLSADNVKWDSNYKEGNIALSLDAGFETRNAVEISIYPAAEMILLKPDLDGVSFLDLGAKLMGRVGIGFPAFDIGVGAAGTAHIGFKDLGGKELREFLDPLDFVVEVGACFDFMPNYSFPLGLILNSGLNYWIEDNFAVGLKYTHWHGYNGGIISARMKFKNQKKAEKAIDKELND